MNRMVVVVFDSEGNGRAGVKVLEWLSSGRDITLFANALIEKNAEGRVSIVYASDSVPRTTGYGILSGLLIGTLGGPVGVAVGMLAGSLRGISCDLAQLGVNWKFLDQVDQQLSPGKVALVAEIQEEQPSRLDSCMKALCGVILRQPQAEVSETQMARDFDVLDSEFSNLETQFSKANEQAKEKLKTRLDAAKVRLYASHEKAKARIAEAKREIEEKGTLNDLIVAANFYQNEQFEEWITEKQIEFERRINELGKSCELTYKATGNGRYVQTHI